MKRSGVLFVYSLLFLLFSSMLSAAKPIPQTLVNASGKNKTLLPDGRLLVTGGQGDDGSLLRTAAIEDPVGRSLLALSATLNIARAWHTATVLPDGTVLIFGGVGIDGRVVAQAEIFNPQSGTFQLLASGPTPRAFHSATILTDGRLLVAGGVSASGAILNTLELWDPRTKSVQTLSSVLTSPRRNHMATLLPDGRVLLQGGKDQSSWNINAADVFDPISQTVSPFSGQAPANGTGLTEARATSPEDGAADVPLDAVIALRFSEPLAIQTVNSQNATLTGPEGAVQARVVGAENGMLAFITPASVLIPGTAYSVSFSGAVDLNNQTVAPKTFTFTTAGESSGDDEDWAPTSDWMTHRGPSKWQSLPPLQAAPGVTALAGQVLKLNGEPLRHVTLKIDNQQTFTEGTGRFLLEPLTAGHHTMLIIGSSANTPARKYGIYEVGINLKAGITNVLTYTIWQTALDSVHTVQIPSPTVSETIVRSPLLPGLELHIPPNTVITGYDGKVVTQINITPIPLDRPPFPLPRVPVPIYFTIQPGSAYIAVKSASGPKGARLFYPNTHNYPPGITYSFWNYDPDVKGWFVYGQGKVSADRSQVIPDTGVVIYELTGAMVSNPSFAALPKTGINGRQDPVDMGTGLFVYHKTDLAMNDIMPLGLARSYRTMDPMSRAFGVGSNFNYNIFLVGNSGTDQYTFQDLVLADGSRVHFVRTSPCNGITGDPTFCNWDNAVYAATTGPPDFHGAVLAFNGLNDANWDNAWKITKKDGTVMFFPEAEFGTDYRNGTITSMADRYGNSLTFDRARICCRPPSQQGTYVGDLLQVTSSSGRFIQFTYDTSDRVTQAKDSAGRTVGYSYDSSGRLSQVTDANGAVWNYTYDSNNNMLTIQDPRGIFYLSNQYDANNRVIQQTGPDNKNSFFSYTTDQNNNVTGATVTDPRGIIEQLSFDANGYITTDVFAQGKPEQQTFTYTRDPNTELVTAAVDPLNRETDYAYDGNGNVTSITRLAHTANAVTTSFTYDPTFNQVTSSTDPLSHVTTFGYDAAGGLASITDPLNHQTTFTTNSIGKVAAVSDALGNTTQFTYTGGDLTAVTDPLMNTTNRFLDGAGRLVQVTNALGRTTRYTYNPLNEISQISDPLNGTTNFTYDGNGNLLTVQDANQNVTTYTYNDHDLVATRTDSLQRTESYNYDANENLATFTDRKGQVTTYQYDSLNRLNFVGFGTQGNTYASTISYQYDAGNRMTQATDSISGIITRGYDGLDRLTSEATPQGSISYTYDSASRRATMQVAGQPQVGYTFDNANRLTQIAQGTSTVGFSYDNSNRRSTLTLPNGIVATYSYDNDSHLTGIAYTLNSTSVGALNYGYDALGMRTSVSGSMARTGLPQPIPSASYDAGNELLAWNEYTLSYDANGNMLSDGVHNYAWDARNHLSTIDAGSTASFIYDPAGRRATKVISGTQTNFFYDLANPVQELSGTTPTANLLAGGLDEYFTRTDASGTANFLTDALGSTGVLADATGTAQTQYTFDPFGKTTQSGASTTNSFAYTGRENDGAGIYFLRARYYNPTFGRFISEDPAGMNSGDVNLYRYVGNSPMNGSDPTGLWSPDAHDALIRHALQPCGVSDKDIRKIQDASRRFDSATGGPEDWAFAHSMRSPGQSVDDAVAQRNDFIANQLEIARDQYQAGDSEFALGQFGWGIHPVMDLTSPEHTLPNGDPIVWCAPVGCWGNNGHSPWDWTHIGHERTPDITPYDYAAEDEAIRDAYSFMTGQKLACRK